MSRGDVVIPPRYSFQPHFLNLYSLTRCRAPSEARRPIAKVSDQDKGPPPLDPDRCNSAVRDNLEMHAGISPQMVYSLNLTTPGTCFF